ncbi:hypothetical protein ELQ35_00605 [Peribacillus cavernae]|uniref:Helix-hairpin-helix DNA-binding motif class 1 domain-containing protein n=1 Tax=Peribacillus cavernae TaxID=1674310 RepID=A0A3S0U7R2_9BACI|nr:helix-hairpin-helix domain-containing protein [Peribacillus cavernae]MDQ0218235.1 competence protein ComEA [Peribacillus cavernae]RUQ32631.1 hypothetical protein ELQ35_00605 [Peribacillus cavernae]
MKISQKKKLVLLPLILILSIAGYYFYQQSLDNGKNESDKYFDEEGPAAYAAEENDFEAKGETAQETTKKPLVVKVDIKGAVKMPGVFTAKEGDRVIDLITRAGNFTANADKDKVNLAQLVEDQMVIYVPEVGEETGMPIAEIPAAGAAVTNGSASGAGEKVNLNTAVQADLETLPGIGPSKATAILEYREKSGPFKTIEDMKNITGIGDKTFEKLKDSISVN